MGWPGGATDLCNGGSPYNRCSSAAPWTQAQSNEWLYLTSIRTRQNGSFWIKDFKSGLPPLRSLTTLLRGAGWGPQMQLKFVQPRKHFPPHFWLLFWILSEVTNTQPTSRVTLFLPHRTVTAARGLYLEAQEKACLPEAPRPWGLTEHSLGC